MSGSEGKVFEEILQRLTRVETKMDYIINAKEVAQDAHASTRSAHKRIDSLEQEMAGTTQELTAAITTVTNTVGEQAKSIATLAETNKSDARRLDKVEKIVFWAGTTLVLTMIGVISYLIKQGG